MITDTAASVGAKPNSRNPRILTVIGCLARAHQEQRQVDVGERMDEGEHRAGDDAALDERQMTCSSVRQREAPRLAAASSRFGGSVCRLTAIVRTANGRQMTT